MDRFKFSGIIEKDEDGFFVGEVPQLKACYDQGKTIDELMANMRDVIALALEDHGGVELCRRMVRTTSAADYFARS